MRNVQFADPEEYSYVGPFIAKLRGDLGVTQAQVSDATGFSIQSISRFENGKSSPATIMGECVIEYVVSSLDIDLTELMDMFDEFIASSKNSGPIVDS